MKEEIHLGLLSWLVSTPTIRHLEKGNRLKQKSAYKRIAKWLYKDIWDTDETRKILDRIKPLKQ